MTLEVKLRDQRYFDEDLLPSKQGVYLARGLWGSEDLQPIDVYEYSPKGLCCFSEDFGGVGAGVNDEHDCHTSVQCTGLEFMELVGELR